jgi:hypothetical protein
MGCCLFASVLAGAPRFAFVLWWLFQPGRINATFSTIFWPILGVLFMPWTTLMYVFVYPGGFSTFDWILLGCAVLVDLATYAGNGRASRTRYASE